MQKAKTEKARVTKAYLIEQARALILELGIEQLSMDRLAKYAGYSKGAVMYHFPSKRHLQAALIQDYADHLEGELQRQLKRYPDQDVPNFLRAYIDWFDSFSQDRYGWPRLGVTLLSQVTNDPELMKPVRDWYDGLYTRIEAVEEGPARSALMLALMSLEGFFYTRKFGLHPTEEMRRSAIASLRKRVDHWDAEIAKS